jgi:hypothetical protein
MFAFYCFSVAEQHRKLNSIAEFTNIARPSVGSQHLERHWRHVESASLGPVSCPCLARKLDRQRTDVLDASAKRADREHNSLEAEIEVLPKSAFRNLVV